MKTIEEINRFHQLVVWQGTIVSKEKKEEFIAWIEKEFGCRAKYECEIKTLPDYDLEGVEIPETGGRTDLFFYIHDEDIGKFAVPRLQYEMKWWEDVLYNGGADLYTEEFLNSHPKLW